MCDSQRDSVAHGRHCQLTSAEALWGDNQPLVAVGQVKEPEAVLSITLNIPMLLAAMVRISKEKPLRQGQEHSETVQRGQFKTHQ